MSDDFDDRHPPEIRQCEGPTCSALRETYEEGAKALAWFAVQREVATCLSMLRAQARAQAADAAEAADMVKATDGGPMWVRRQSVCAYAAKALEQAVIDIEERHLPSRTTPRRNHGLARITEESLLRNAAEVVDKMNDGTYKP